MSSSRHLILCTAVGYNWAQVGPFVRSLRRTGYNGEVLMLVGALSAEDRDHFAAHRVMLWRIRTLLERLPRMFRQKLASRRLRRFHDGIARLHRLTSSPRSWSRNAVGRLARSFEHITCARYDYYRQFLDANAMAFDRVMTSDTRDVLFQADPFGPAPTAPLEFFLEHRSTTLGGEISNANWMRSVYGEEELAAIAHRPVSCSGITFGETSAMRAYLAAMSDEFVRYLPHTAGLPFIDQATHNYLLWNNRLPAARSVPNGTGAVLTMHGIPESELHFDADGYALNEKGSRIPVLHQFDRHPAHANRLLQLLG